MNFLMSYSKLMIIIIILTLSTVKKPVTIGGTNARLNTIIPEKPRLILAKFGLKSTRVAKVPAESAPFTVTPDVMKIAASIG